jgi:transcriptional regulator with XRE-family HTH domain
MPPRATKPHDTAPAALRLGWALRERRERIPATRPQLAERLGYSPDRVKQVETGAYPPSAAYLSRWTAIYGPLDHEVQALWDLVTATNGVAGTADTDEVIRVYPRRAHVPAGLWRDLFASARERIDILVYAGVFLHESYPEFTSLLRTASQAGCTIRILLGDPDAPAVIARGQEERFGHGIQTRCRIALLHYQPLIGLPGIQVHLHGTTLYNSIYRADQQLLVNTHVYGHNAYDAPILHLRQRVPGGLFDTYTVSFDAVWAASTPAPSDPASTLEG